MTTLLLTSIILVFLLIILGITYRKPIISLIHYHQDTKLRKWCVQQATIRKTFDYITYLSDEEIDAIFPEKYKKKDDS